MSDIQSLVERLREFADQYEAFNYTVVADAMREAAAELARLTAENKRLAGEADAMKVTTKDGARIRPTVDQVWLEFDRTNNNKAEPVTKGPWQTTPGAWSYFDGDWYIGWGGPQYDERLVSDCYSTEAAALAARKGEQPA